MEEWERELREKLEKELPEGGYCIGCDDPEPNDPNERKFLMYTGKGGKINYEVELQRAIRKYRK